MTTPAESSGAHVTLTQQTLRQTKQAEVAMQALIREPPLALSTRRCRQSDEKLFLTFCERYAAASNEQAALLTRAAEARRAGDQDAMDEIADAIDDHEAECRLLLCHIYEMVERCDREAGHS